MKVRTFDIFWSNQLLDRLYYTANYLDMSVSLTRWQEVRCVVVMEFGK